MNDERITIKLYDISFLIMTWIFFLILSVAILFMFNIPVNEFHFVISVILAIYVNSLFGHGVNNKRNFSILCIITGMIVWVLILFCTHIYMNVWDSNAYHKQAIGLLKNGWNPIFQSSFEFESVMHTTQLYSIDPLTWAEVYPKGTWYFGAVIYKLTGNIEAGKVYTLLSMVVVFGVVFDYLCIKTSSKIKSGLVSLVIACNPIAMAQFKCFYNDGFACNIILLLLIELIIIEDKDYRYEKNRHWLMVMMAVVIGCNLKMSILLFDVIICATYCIFKGIILLKENSTKDAVWMIVKVWLRFLFAGIIGVFVVGITPFLTNVKRYGNIFYQTDSLIAMASEQVAGLKDCTSNFQAFFVSLFGKMNSFQYDTIKNVLKIPLSVYETELGWYRYADLRISGMGIWFSAIFILSIIIITCYLWKKKFYLCENRLGIIFCMVLFVSFCILPLTYQHRYIGFIIFYPLMAILLLESDINNKRERIMKGIIESLLLFMLFVNMIPWIKVTIDMMDESVNIETQLKQMQKDSADGQKYNVRLINEQFVGLLYNLQDYEINYVYQENLDESKAIQGAIDGGIQFQISNNFD